MTENELVNQAAHGSDEAFNTLVKPYLKQAHQTAYLLLHDYNLAEDAVQEALIQLHRSLPKFNPEKASFKTWFNRIVIHMSMKQSRKRWFNLEFKEAIPQILRNPPEEKYVLSEDHAFIYQCVRKLKRKYLSVIVLHYFQELSVKEVAETLNIHEGTVKSRLNKARSLLRTMMAASGESEIGKGGHIWNQN
ncbi:antiterminator Q family protein [Cohnella algarum]|uniref:antiterminator Q family protein n=1 Tax=Cohnella algarum TaxID=2044859 RepID=UPI001966DEDD|nr:sigma-70 family RNA polymerase sigma factor [Cohnella algarum]